MPTCILNLQLGGLGTPPVTAQLCSRTPALLSWNKKTLSEVLPLRWVRVCGNSTPSPWWTALLGSAPAVEMRCRPTLPPTFWVGTSLLLTASLPPAPRLCTKSTHKGASTFIPALHRAAQGLGPCPRSVPSWLALL